MDDDEEVAHQKWRAREMILHGDDPVKRFKRIDPFYQLLGLKAVSREAQLCGRLAMAAGPMGVGFLIGAYLIPLDDLTALGFYGFGVFLLFVALISFFKARSRRAALLRLADAGVLTPDQTVLILDHRMKAD